MIVFKEIIKDKKNLLVGILVFNIYFFVYYWSINYLNLTSAPSKVVWANNWPDLFFKQISTFTYEPIGLIQLGPIQLLIAPMNILIGFGLGFLVFLNITAAIYIYKLPKQCRIDHKYSGLIGILPSFLTGFACCAPTFLIPLAGILGSTTTFFTKLFRWFLPISIVLLVWSFYKSYKLIKLQN